MSVVVPPVFTPVNELELSENRPVSEETVRKIVHNVNLLGQLSPIGLVVAIAVNTPAVPQPDPTLFQYCDGSQITNITSPLRATSGHPRSVPNMADKYLRGAPNATSNPDTGDLATGGTLIRDLSHNHGGGTGFVCTGRIGEDGNERHGYDADICHNHSISEDLSDSDPVDLKHVQTAYYLKIN